MKGNKTIIALFAASMSFMQASAQTVLSEISQNAKIGGYIIGKYNYNDQDGQTTNGGFDIRLGRLYVDGKFQDLTYKLQMEVNGTPANATTSGQKTVRIVDAWAEYTKIKEAKVRFGQFKRAFTFENPYNPWDVGFHANAQVIDKLAGMNDRCGEHASGGRDLGIQIQGDLLPVGADKHTFVHYQVAAYNGQGINNSDKNKDKDIIGGLWVNPIKELSIGAFGWSGNYTSNNITIDRKRMAFGVKYESKWTVRAEYVSSVGHKISDYSYNDATKLQTLKATAAAGHSDGWYMAVGVPVNNKLKVYGKWDVYRDQKNSDSQKNLYVLAANYYFNKNLKLQGSYFFTYDKTNTKDRHYNTVDLQLYWRF